MNPELFYRLDKHSIIIFFFMWGLVAHDLILILDEETFRSLSSRIAKAIQGDCRRREGNRATVVRSLTEYESQRDAVWGREAKRMTSQF